MYRVERLQIEHWRREGSGRLSQLNSGALSQSRAWSVRLRYRNHGGAEITDNADVRPAISEMNGGRPIGIPWAMQLEAVTCKEPFRLVRLLTGAILDCGGWVLCRSVNDAGTIWLVFEFERGDCVDIYGALVAAGVEFSPQGHMKLTELCQCTRSRQQSCAEEIASVELEVQAYPAELAELAELAGSAELS
jgi:hypothetical protein